MVNQEQFPGVQDPVQALAHLALDWEQVPELQAQVVAQQVQELPVPVKVLRGQEPLPRGTGRPG
jgi:hypothetical protein